MRYWSIVVAMVFSLVAFTAEVRAAEDPKVVMYSTSWCGICKRARDYMTSRGIPFTEYDVEKTEIGRSHYQQLNGRGVPVILVGQQRMDGFNAAHFAKMLDRAGVQRKQ